MAVSRPHEIPRRCSALNRRRAPRVLQRMMVGGLLDKGGISLRSRELMSLPLASCWS